MSVHVKVNPLDWESQFFGIQSVRLETGGTLPLESALQHPCALFQIKVPADQTATIDALNQHQFQLVEGEAELSSRLNEPSGKRGFVLPVKARSPHCVRRLLRPSARVGFVRRGLRQKRADVFTRSGLKMRYLAPLIISVWWPAMTAVRCRDSCLCVR